MSLGAYPIEFVYEPKLLILPLSLDRVRFSTTFSFRLEEDLKAILFLLARPELLLKEALLIREGWSPESDF